MPLANDSVTTPDANEDRFAFGRNWRNFATSIDPARLEAAADSLQRLLRGRTLAQQRFLDAGCGSGLFSLAALQGGAIVTSFDLDPDSVACAEHLKLSAAPPSSADKWNITAGSLLDPDFLRTLGTFDVVYCWGVAHHTGRMWEAIENLTACVAPGGTLILAIYNDQLYVSRIWRGTKRLYQKLPRWLRPPLVAAIAAAQFLKRFLVTLAAALLRIATLRNPLVPFQNWSREVRSRGMHAWYDLVDWVGGWPFEVARPEEVFRFLRDRGFQLDELTTSPGHGCNEFAARRTGSTLPHS